MAYAFAIGTEINGLGLPSATIKHSIEIQTFTHSEDEKGVIVKWPISAIKSIDVQNGAR